MPNTLNIGLVGCGFMGRTHSNAFLQAPRYFDLPRTPVLKAVCARTAETAKAFAANWGYASFETDWRALVARDDIDLIDIATPNDTHAEIAVAAARAGKMVACEKPLGRTPAESARMVEAVETAGVANMVWYNYRRAPAVTLAKAMIEAGRLGRIFHYRAKFLQDWTMSQDLPQGGAALWRLDASVAGSGVTGDLLAHCIDAAQWLNGPIAEVSAMTETFIKERTHALTGERQPVTIDDASAFLARFENGSLGTFEATRYARGHKALAYVRDQRRARLAGLGPARSASPAVLRPPRRWTDARLALDPRDRSRAPLHASLVGAGARNQLRAHLHPSGGGFPARNRGRNARAEFPRSVRDGPGGRRGAGLGPEPAVGTVGPLNSLTNMAPAARRRTSRRQGVGR